VLDCYTDPRSVYYAGSDNNAILCSVPSIVTANQQSKNYVFVISVLINMIN